jgi:hypothetical protein
MRPTLIGNDKRPSTGLVTLRVGWSATRKVSERFVSNSSVVGGALRRDVNFPENYLVDLIFARQWDPSSESNRVLLGLCE